MIWFLGFKIGFVCLSLDECKSLLVFRFEVSSTLWFFFFVICHEISVVRLGRIKNIRVWKLFVMNFLFCIVVLRMFSLIWVSIFNVILISIIMQIFSNYFSNYIYLNIETKCIVQLITESFISLKSVLKL